MMNFYKQFCYVECKKMYVNCLVTTLTCYKPKFSPLEVSGKVLINFTRTINLDTQH